ncbi:MAG: cardiolipin synthase [Muribaculaceae bacterium]|nr:cardiolipin synthase [Muribaculaceae bacterium]
MIANIIVSSDWITMIGIIVYFVIVISCVIVVLSENRNPIRSLAWIIALVALPGVGLIFYLFFGRSLRGHQLISRHNKRKLLHNSNPKSANLARLPITDAAKQLIKLAYSLTHSPLCVNNRIEIFTTGREKFRSFIDDLKRARRQIYIQYYIFSDDSLGMEIADILIAKAQEGVSVKVLYDHVGSFSASNSFFKKMKQGGVDIHPFFRVTFPQLANRINWRNHRKIVIIDNSIAYIGGMNIARRYVDGMKDGSAWRDTHFRLEGQIVQPLLYSFAVDWYFLKSPDYSINTQYIPSREIHNECGMQLVTSGPIDSWNNLSLCFLKAISSARRSIYIQTPYFLPTDNLLNALEAAALSNVDVRIMIPAKCDSILLQLASYSYVSRCLKAGIKVYRYRPGMLHAKAMTIDDDFSTAGSTNFDFRSFENNFEANLLIYDHEVNARMRDIFFADLKNCDKINCSVWNKRPFPQRILESLVRLFAPIL